MGEAYIKRSDFAGRVLHPVGPAGDMLDSHADDRGERCKPSVAGVPCLLNPALEQNLSAGL